MFLSVLLLLGPVVAATLIPRELIFSDPKYSSVSLSPNGRFFAYIAPDENKVKNVFVKCTNCKHNRQVTFERSSDVLSYSWTGVEDVIIYGQDHNGDENTMLFKKNISDAAIAADSEKRIVISDRAGVKAVISGNNHRDSRVLIGLNDENPAYHNVYSFDLLTDSMTLIMKNNRFPMIVVDNALNIRLVGEQQQDGSLMYFKPSAKANPVSLTSDHAEWDEYLLVQPDDLAITSPVAFDKSNNNMYWLWGDEHSDLGSLVMFPFDAVDQKEVLYSATRAQIGTILIHPTDKTLLAVTEVYHKPELFVANDTVMDDLQYLVNLRPYGSLQILSMSLDMTTWLVTYLSSDKPHEVFLYRSWLKTAEFLFNTHPELEKYKLNRQVGFDFKTRDDMVLQAYLSLPPEVPLRTAQEVPAADRSYAELGMLPVEPQKLVVLVHGGPKARDHYGYSSLNVFLTNRGYAVLQVNFRGSVGFGKRLTNAGDGEWGRKMHYDILDAVEFAVAKGITNKSQVAIMGGSYGGYETLAALSFTPDEFACGVDIVGPSNLVTLLEAVPPYWRGFYKDLVRMVGGDIDTEEGRQSLTARSPLHFADRVKKPLMILQGANDPRVKQQESDQFVAALKKNNIPVSYVLYPDEGHGFRKANNRLAQCGFIEKFLHMCLGGRYEPYQQGQHNSSAILMSDGFAAAVPATIPPLPIVPTLAPQLFYRPIIPRPVRPTMYLPPTANVLTRIFPQYRG
ncbi:hypothetical protein V3C99_000618 [Haemonchus contortus]